MEFYRQPDRIRVGPIAVPGVGRVAILINMSKRIVSVARRHMDLLVKRRIVTLEEFLDSPRAVDLRMNFQEWMFVMQIAVGVGRRPPQVQADAVLPEVAGLLPLIGEREGVECDCADLVVT
ncbi:hypothetical protein D3C87_1695870 [compost metagenome]